MEQDMEVSVFKLYSIGTAAENLEFGQTKLEVWPSEQFPEVDGDVTSNQTNISTDGENADGQKYTQNINTGNVLQAEWLPRDTNRAFPSLIRRGELVLIYRNSDSDEFYWEEMGKNIHYRRGDIWCIACVSTVVEKDTPIGPKNAYWLEIDSLNGMVNLSTTKLNGEAAEYKLEIQARDGRVEIADDLGNFFRLESPDQRWTLMNGAQSSLVMDAENVTLSMTGKYTVNAQEVEYNIQDTITENATTKVENITESFTLNTITATMTADTSYTINAATIGLNGNIGAGGFGGGVGTAKFNSSLDVTGPVGMQSGLDVAGTIMNDGLNVTTHRHKDSRNGDCSTPIP